MKLIYSPVRGPFSVPSRGPPRQPVRAWVLDKNMYEPHWFEGDSVPSFVAEVLLTNEYYHNDDHDNDEDCVDDFICHLSVDLEDDDTDEN